MTLSLCAEERALQTLYHLDEAQLRWRRWCIAANCSGDPEIFAEEYPANAEEAFLKSGRPVFPMRVLTAAFAAAPEPERGALCEEAGKISFVQGADERLSLYQLPIAGREYVIGCDVAAGLKGGDYSVLTVLDKTKRDLAAIWHGHIEPDLFALEAERLARWYGRALLVPEANNHGIALLGGLRRLHYGHVFRRSSGEEGFLTTERSKAEIIGRLAAFIRTDAARIRDKPTLAECMHYVYDEKGRTNAESSCHDDRVMALAIALHATGEATEGLVFQEADWRVLYGANETTGY